MLASLVNLKFRYSNILKCKIIFEMDVEIRSAINDNYRDIEICNFLVVSFIVSLLIEAFPHILKEEHNIFFSLTLKII